MKTIEESEYFSSKEFKADMQKRIEEDTWGKDLPKIYLNENKQLVKHWKDRAIEIIKGALLKERIKNKHGNK